MEEKEKGENEHTQPFTARGFYGRAQSQDQVLLRVAKTRKHLRQRPLIRDYRPGILGPPATWKTFRRQADAIKFAQVQGNGLMVFSFEGEALGQGGKRNFVVTHPKMMWVHQCERNLTQRCTYEVIQENSVCKLYFDLEFMYTHNSESDGLQMTNTFIKIVCYFLLKEFGVHCSRENIVDLTSHSFAKFSRHLIFNIPDVAFANNIYVGNFVNMICNQIRTWAREGMKETLGFKFSDVERLFVTDTKGNKVLFCDEGVYTKNRNFRILRSTKFGKNSPLVVAQENQYVPLKKAGESTEELLFMDSLVTTVRESPRILTFGDDGTKRSQCQQERKGSGPGMEGFSHSPYPEIDKYIQSILGQGYIRCWFYFPQSELLVYEIANNRFCHNIGREHKSNGIMYVANLKLAVYYQKCHDPDCQDYRSNPIPLPEWTVFWKNMGEDEVMEWIQEPQSDTTGIWNDSDDDSLLSMVATQVENEQKSSIMTAAATQFENEDDNNLIIMAAAQVEKEDLSDSELTSAVSKFEMWDKIDEMSLSSLSRQNSLQSSQKSNPWDKLSLISSPNSSFFDESSQKSSDGCGINFGPETFSADQKVQQNLNTYDFDSDEDFASAAAKVEEEMRNQAWDEVEFNSCGLDDEDFLLP